MKFKGEGDSMILAKFVKNFEVWNNYVSWVVMSCSLVEFSTNNKANYCKLVTK